MGQLIQKYMNQSQLFCSEDIENIVEAWSAKITETSLNIKQKNQISNLLATIKNAILEFESDYEPGFNDLASDYSNSRSTQGAVMTKVAEEYFLLREEISDYYGKRRDLSPDIDN